MNKYQSYSQKINNKIKKNLENRNKTNIINNLSQNTLKTTKKTISKNKKLQIKHKEWILKNLEFKKKPILSKSFRKRFNKKQKSQLLSNITEISNSLPEIFNKIKCIKPEKSKKHMAEFQKQEIARFNIILQHPDFQTNPWANIKQYIKNSVEKKEGTLIGY
ncbi:hypothetical protein PCANB_001831 [Pneumocystis canis]|nr:hypothetical protein PCK1_002167 [Pneumocystis canis]KAG5440261.1 hypothetical protein PCANB_001831 [Pneumocystis canis]